MNHENQAVESDSEFSDEEQEQTNEVLSQPFEIFARTRTISTAPPSFQQAFIPTPLPSATFDTAILAVFKPQTQILNIGDPMLLSMRTSKAERDYPKNNPNHEQVNQAEEPLYFPYSDYWSPSILRDYHEAKRKIFI